MGTWSWQPNSDTFFFSFFMFGVLMKGFFYEIFDIVGTGLQSPWEKKKIIKNSKWCLSESITIQTGFLYGVGLGLGDRHFNLRMRMTFMRKSFISQNK